MDTLYKTKTVFRFPNPEKVMSEAGCEENFKPWPVVGHLENLQEF
jgi:hypothetical protein